MARHRQFLIAAFAFVMFTQAAHGFTRRAFAWYPGTGSTSIPSGSLYARSSHGDRVDVERTGQGSYIVSFRGLARSGYQTGHVQVSPYGSVARLCQPGGWFANGEDLHAFVGCFDKRGARADSAFTINVL